MSCFVFFQPPYKYWIHLCCCHNISFPFGHCLVISIQQVVQFVQLFLSALQVLPVHGQVGQRILSFFPLQLLNEMICLLTRPEPSHVQWTTVIGSLESKSPFSQVQRVPSLFALFPTSPAPLARLEAVLPLASRHKNMKTLSASWCFLPAVSQSVSVITGPIDYLALWASSPPPLSSAAPSGLWSVSCEEVKKNDEALNMPASKSDSTWLCSWRRSTTVCLRLDRRRRGAAKILCTTCLHYLDDCDYVLTRLFSLPFFSWATIVHKRKRQKNFRS